MSVESSAGSSRVLRGGSWGDLSGFARVADRGRYLPGRRLYFLGFRLVRRMS